MFEKFKYFNPTIWFFVEKCDEKWKKMGKSLDKLIQ